MKKTYIIPELEVLNMAPATLIAESIVTGGDYEGGGNDVKAHRGDDYSGGRTSVGSVWDDDWSK